MKKVLGVFLAVGLLLTAGSAVAADKTFLSIATGGVAGTYYPLGGGLAQVMNSHVPDVEVTAETGNAFVPQKGCVLIGADYSQIE